MLKHDAVALAAISTLQSHLKLLEADARGVVLADLLELRASAGVKSASIMLPSGEVVGNVTLTQPSAPGAKVADADVLLAHARQAWPDRIVHFPEQVIPAHDELPSGFLAEILAGLREDGDGGAVDEDGCCVPGVTVDTRLPEPKAFSVTKLDREAIIRAWSRGDLAGIIASNAPALADGHGE